MKNREMDSGQKRRVTTKSSIILFMNPVGLLSTRNKIQNKHTQKEIILCTTILQTLQWPLTGFRIKFRFCTMLCLALLAPTILPISSHAQPQLFILLFPQLQTRVFQNFPLLRLVILPYRGLTSIPSMTSQIFTSDALFHHLVYFFPSPYHNHNY